MAMPTGQAKEHNENQDYVGGERSGDIEPVGFYRVGPGTHA